MTIVVPAHLADHEPGERDLGGWPRCTACGFRYPCPDVRSALPEHTAHEIEVIALIDIGWTIWKARPQADGWSDADDIGGTVIGWWDQADDDGGEQRQFRCLDFPRGKPRVHSVAAGDVDINASSMPNAATLRRAARVLAREFSQRKGIVSEFDVALLENAVTLLRCIA